MDENVSVQVLLFAAARELAGTGREQLALPGRPAAPSALLDAVVAQLPALRPLRSTLLLALNMNYVRDEDGPVTLRAGDELALIPPVSGG